MLQPRLCRGFQNLEWRVDSEDFDATAKPLQERLYQKAAISDGHELFCHPAFSNNKNATGATPVAFLFPRFDFCRIVPAAYFNKVILCACTKPSV
ncbi:MAG: hypothetical protein DKINENOH_04645 [bacterium]|nr:hypothetical protein [bacterium]